MEFAASTLLVFFSLIIPSLIFIKCYYNREFSDEYIKTTNDVLTIIIRLVLPGLILQAVYGYLLVPLFSSEEIDPAAAHDVVLEIFNRHDNDNRSSDFGKLFEKMWYSRNSIILYHVWLYVLSAGTGTLWKFIVRKTRLDRKSPWFRYPNKWYYIFRGEILDFPNIRGETRDIDFIYVDALVNIGEAKNYLYSGLLADYELAKEGIGYKYIALSYAKRRPLEGDRPPGVEGPNEQYYKIPGDLFIITADKITNLNFSYYHINPTEPASPSWTLKQRSQKWFKKWKSRVRKLFAF